MGNSGKVMCFGSRTYGQIGDGVVSLLEVAKPTLVPGLANIEQVVAGSHHTCARDKGDNVFCWGEQLQQAVGRQG